MVRQDGLTAEGRHYDPLAVHEDDGSTLDEELRRLDADDLTPRSAHFASRDEKKRLWVRNALINAIFISSWFAFSTLLSVYNKWMFSPKYFGFPFPVFVTSAHMYCQFTFALLLRTIFPRSFRPEQRPSAEEYGKKVAPTALATCLDIGLSNLSLKTVTLSFYTMCKSSSLIFVLGFAFLFRLERFSIRLISVIFIIAVGVVLMVASKTQFVLSGMILVLSAAASGGLRWSLTQLLLRKKDMGLDNPVATIFWLAPVMAITLSFLCLVIEGPFAILSSKFFTGLAMALKTSLFILAAGFIAFAMVLAEFYTIQRMGVVPMSIAGIFKEVTTIALSAWIFGDELTPINITGVIVTFGGISLFTYDKYRKSMDSPIPLDAHGNPIVEEDASPGELEMGTRIADHERQPLTQTEHERSKTSNEERRSPPTVLFDTDDSDDAKSDSSDSSDDDQTVRRSDTNLLDTRSLDN